MPKLKKDVNNGDVIADSNEDTGTGLYSPTWRDYPIGIMNVLIIGSFGEVSDTQTIQVAHKLVLNDQQDHWMTKEIDLIRDMKQKDTYCHYVLVQSDLPGTERSKDYYLEKIRNFLINCKQDGGK